MAGKNREDSWPFMIASDVDYSDGTNIVRLVTELARYDFATVEKSPDGSVEIRKVHLKDLRDFDGPLFQADSDEVEQAIVLTEVQLSYWPFDDDEDDDEEHEKPLDRPPMPRFRFEPTGRWQNLHKSTD